MRNTRRRWSQPPVRSWLVILPAILLLTVAAIKVGDRSPRQELRDFILGEAPSGQRVRGPRREDFVLNGQGVVIATPDRESSRAVLFLHGSGQNSRSLFVDPVRKPVADALLTAGFAVAASDANLDNWGSQGGVAAHLDLAAELRRRKYSEFYVVAESMGGLALPAVAAGVNAKAAVAWYPVCDIGSVIRTGRFNQSIASAYGGSLQPPAGLSPVTFAQQPTLRLAIWASDQDTVVPKAENADVCASQARVAGVQVTQVATAGEHGDPGNIQPANLVEFFSSGPG